MWVVCCRCGKHKALWEFNRRSGDPFSIQRYCRFCQNNHNKKYKKDNVLYISGYRKKYNREHSEDIRKYNINYHFEHRDDIHKRQKLYRRFNLDRDALRSSKRRAVKLNQSVKLTKDEKYRIGLLYKWADVLGQDFQVDHIIPLSKGGLHHPDNMQVIPRIQNIKKKDKDPKKFYGKYYNFITNGDIKDDKRYTTTKENKSLSIL